MVLQINLMKKQQYATSWMFMIIDVLFERSYEPWILIPVSSKSVENVEVVGVWIFANWL